jgi:hypothetical protein
LCGRAAVYVCKILKAVKLADLLVEQPTKLDFIISINRSMWDLPMTRAE